MLKRFTVSNFRSFRDEAVLDLSATGVREHSYHVRASRTGDRILPVAAIYGSNASGKSNLYLAMEYMRDAVLLSTDYSSAGEDARRRAYKGPDPYLLSRDSAERPSRFEVSFTMDGLDEDDTTLYTYGFEADRERVCSEWLYTRARTARKSVCVFERDTRSRPEFRDWKRIPVRERRNLETVMEGQTQTLAVSVGRILRIPVMQSVYKWFASVELHDFASPVETIIRARQIPEGLPDDEAVRDRVVAYLHGFDSSITRLRTEPVREDQDEEDGDRRYRLWSEHRLEDGSGTVPIDFGSESAGTRKMFMLYDPLRQVMQRGGVLFTDELYARLHPLLFRGLVQMFPDPEQNRRGAQLIFTSHDTNVLSRDLLRRDEIFLVETSSQGASELYSLWDVEEDDGARIRGDADYEKNYLLGRYGAIPAIGPISVSPERSAGVGRPERPSAARAEDGRSEGPVVRKPSRAESTGGGEG